MRLLIRILGRFVVALVLAIPFLLFGLLSGNPYVGGGKIFFYACTWIILVGGFLWGMAVLVEAGFGIRQLPANSVTPSSRSTVGEIHSSLSNREESKYGQDSSMPVELQPVLEVADVRKFVAAASRNQIRLAHADEANVSRFFNAIRYGQTAAVRKAISASPLLILAKDAYGNTPLEVAVLEKNNELQILFKECLVKV